MKRNRHPCPSINIWSRFFEFFYSVYDSLENFPPSFLLTSTENLAATVTARRELRVVAIAAVDLVGLGAELLVDQRHAAFVAQEARLVPVFLLVRQILRRRTGFITEI